MKQSNRGFVAALLLAAVSSGAGASDLGITLQGCHASASSPGIPSQSTPRLFCVGPVVDGGREVVPKVCTDSVSTPPVSTGGASDIYCSAVASVGSSVLTITDNANCDADQTGVVITRSGSSSWSFDLKKNGASVQGFPIGNTSVNGPLALPICYVNTGSQ